MVTIVDNEVEDYGSDCLGIESYIWSRKELVSEEEYTPTVTHSYSEVTQWGTITILYKLIPNNDL